MTETTSKLKNLPVSERMQIIAELIRTDCLNKTDKEDLTRVFVNILSILNHAEKDDLVVMTLYKQDLTRINSKIDEARYATQSSINELAAILADNTINHSESQDIARILQFSLACLENLQYLNYDLNLNSGGF